VDQTADQIDLNQLNSEIRFDLDQLNRGLIAIGETRTQLTAQVNWISLRIGGYLALFNVHQINH